MPNPALGDTLSVMLHAKQLEILHDKHRFKVVACGRRFGKTTLCAIVIVLLALSKPEQILWIVSPTFPQTMYMWRQIKRIIPKKFIKSIKEGEKFIEIVNGSTVWAKSGDNPDGLVGEGLDFVAIDEASRCKEEVWEVLRPSLADKGGECWFLSTPKGKNWFYKMFLMERSDPKSYKSFSFTTHDNPIIPRDEIEEMKANMPELVYMQEVMAHFIDSGGIVFRNLNKCLGAEEEPPIEGHSYIIGADLGKHQDWTVLTVGDTTNNRVVHMERFNKIDWEYQKEQLRNAVKRYNNACVVLDTSGAGDVVYDDLSNDGISIEPYRFTNVTKNLLITNLMRTMDNGLVQLPDDPELIKEFETFEFEITEKGHVTYNAPSGLHDDIVISVALCVWGLQNSSVNVIGRSDTVDSVYKERAVMSSYDDPNSLSYDEEDYDDFPKYGVNRVKLYL
jgi:hypothetical protein